MQALAEVLKKNNPYTLTSSLFPPMLGGSTRVRSWPLLPFPAHRRC